ncbi:Glycoside hydrolase family 47 [Dillenia turbinata]|uniref:alpha-1,2-Mannosidase n=1 Tax=Dillenia turbinata TaxID=194707 RepID=A0AAN8V953_9MAGN
MVSLPRKPNSSETGSGVREMFFHAFDGYMNHAFPLDELRPLSCQGEDSLGGYAFLSTHWTHWHCLVIKNVFLPLLNGSNKTVSVFETTIWILGRLLTAHLIASDYAMGMRIPSYDNELLNLAEDLARRLLPAFDTPTGITSITSTTGGGTLTLEFGVLGHLTKDPIRGLWARRSKLNLVGAHINVFTGEWTQKDAGIGTSIDSFYEYLLKANLSRDRLFSRPTYCLEMKNIYSYFKKLTAQRCVNMNSAAIVWPLFNSLQAFWPGLPVPYSCSCSLYWLECADPFQVNLILNLLVKVLAGDIDPAIRTHAAFFGVWKKYGFTPEGFNLPTLSVQYAQKSYPLRPELMESTYWLYKATRDPRYLNAGRDMVASLQYGARCPCGYCHIVDVESHRQEDHMESFFLAETVKYLWLLFDLAAGPDNLVENGPYKYIFSTEGHLLPATPQIALVHEHCSYFGAYCQRGDLTESRNSGIPRVINGVCPGLAHGQKFGLSCLATTDTMHDDDTATQKEASVIQSPSVVVFSKPNAESLSLDDKNVTGQSQESSQEAFETKLDDENNDKGSSIGGAEIEPPQR